MKKGDPQDFIRLCRKVPLIVLRFKVIDEIPILDIIPKDSLGRSKVLNLDKKILDSNGIIDIRVFLNHVIEWYDLVWVQTVDSFCQRTKKPCQTISFVFRMIGGSEFFEGLPGSKKETLRNYLDLLVKDGWYVEMFETLGFAKSPDGALRTSWFLEMSSPFSISYRSQVPKILDLHGDNPTIINIRP